MMWSQHDTCLGVVLSLSQVCQGALDAMPTSLQDDQQLLLGLLRCAPSDAAASTRLRLALQYLNPKP